DDLSTQEHGSLIDILRHQADLLTNAWSQELGHLTVHLMEDPKYRLAGAEEGVRQVVATIEQVLQHHDPLAQDLARKADEASGRLSALADEVKTGARKLNIDPLDVLELLRWYPKWRFQSLILQIVSASFISLRGYLSDELREINFCRIRLGELSRMFEASSANEGVMPPRDGHSRRLFSAGGDDLAEAVKQFLDGLPATATGEMEVHVQADLETQFQGLVNICVSKANLLKDVEGMMLDTTRRFVSEYLPDTDVAELFCDQHRDAAQAEAELLGFFDEAAPDFAPTRGSRDSEIVLLGTPASRAAEKLRGWVRDALPEVELQTVSGLDEVVFYRESANRSLLDLEQLGPEALDAYRQMSAADNFTPHCRLDIDFQLPQRQTN
ncbi:MAG: hypothetical protein ACRD36_09435, partial [Candidatus Acidiferrum sp.]